MGAEGGENEPSMQALFFPNSICFRSVSLATWWHYRSSHRNFEGKTVGVVAFSKQCVRTRSYIFHSAYFVGSRARKNRGSSSWNCHITWLDVRTLGKYACAFRMLMIDSSRAVVASGAISLTLDGK